jgi:hypothetical protein
MKYKSWKENSPYPKPKWTLSNGYTDTLKCVGVYSAASISTDSKQQPELQLDKLLDKAWQKLELM